MTNDKCHKVQFTEHELMSDKNSSSEIEQSACREDIQNFYASLERLLKNKKEDT